MRTPSRRRSMRRSLIDPPAGTDVQALARKVEYIGSPEHKTRPSFAGAPKLRSDASKCDPSLASAAKLTKWLRKGLRDCQIGGPWEGEFPRYVWYLDRTQWYEGRLVNRELGQYKGYPVAGDELPQGLS